MNTVSLESLHPLVARTLEDLKTAEPDDYGLLWTCRDSLNVTLSKESLLRGMLLMDSLIKKLGSRGYGVEIAIEDEKRVLGLSCRNGGEFKRAGSLFTMPRQAQPRHLLAQGREP